MRSWLCCYEIPFFAVLQWRGYPEIHDGMADEDGFEWVKLTTQTGVHYGMVYNHPGLYTDTNTFNARQECGPSGLYFCRRRDAFRWLGAQCYGQCPIMTTMWTVTIPDGITVRHFKTKSKTHKLVLKDPRPIPRDVLLQAMEFNGNMLQYIDSERRVTDRLLCEAAIANSGAALQFVPPCHHDEALYLLAVRNTGWALRFIHKAVVASNKAIRLAAVTRTPAALEIVPHDLRDTETCRVALLANWHVLEFVPEKLRTLDLCIEAVIAALLRVMRRSVVGCHTSPSPP